MTPSELLNEILEFKIIAVDKFTLTVWNVLWFVVVLVVAWLIIRLVKLVLNRRVVSHDMDSGSINSLVQLIKYFVYTIAIILVLESAGVKTTVLLASSTALLVGIGLGLQQFFYDGVSGVVLLFEGSIKVGDVVEVRHEIIGKVKYIGLRTSKIETRDNTYVIVPNSKFVSGDVVNWSHIVTSTRFDVQVGVAYGSDVQLVKECLLKAVKGQAGVEEHPAPFVRFGDFGDSALLFNVFFWTSETFLVENLKSEIRFEIDRLFRENKIQIPFPQRDLHIRSSSVPLT